MRTLLGFYCIQRRSSLLGGFYVTYWSDNGYGELIPAPFPYHAINTANQ